MKSRLFLPVLLTALSLCQLAQAADARVTTTFTSPSRIEFSLRTGDLSVSEIELAGLRFDQFKLPGEGVSDYSGAGLLPTITRFVALPAGATLHASAKVVASHRLETGRTPLPADLDPTDSQAAPSFGATPDLSTMVTVGQTSVMRGVHLAPVTIYPVRLGEAAGSYTIADHIEVTLDIESGANASTLPKSLRADSDLDRLLQGSDVLNVQRDWPPEFAPAGRYLVLIHEECLPFAIPLLEWKRQAGYKVEVMSYSGDELSANGVESQIRDRIRDIYEEDISAGRETFDYIWIIGDREGNAAGNPWTFPSFSDLTTMPDTPPHADWVYGNMDRDSADFLMDIAVGRLPGGNASDMEMMVARQLAYEKRPYMDDTTWFTKAGVFSEQWGDNWSEDVYLNVRWSEQLIRRAGFSDIRNGENLASADSVHGIEPILREMFDEGRGVLIGRAQVHPWWQNLPELDDNRIYPFCINFSGHGEFAAHTLFCDASIEHMKGPVVWTNGWGQPITKFSNAVWNALVSGVFAHDLPIGWARVNVGLNLPRVIPNRDVAYRQYQTDLDLFGDPGLKPWIGVPRRVTMRHPPARVGMDLFGVRLTNPADSSPVKQARVTIYQPGDLPDPADYADWSPNLMQSGITNDSGGVRFVIPGSLQAGVLYVTVTGKDILPIWDSVNVTASNPPLFMVDNIEIPNDGRLLAGSRVDLNLTIFNSGGDARGVIAGIVSNSELVQVVADADTASFGDVARGRQATADRPVTIQINPGCPNGFHPQITIIYSHEGGTVNGALDIDVEAPELSAVPYNDPFALDEDVDISPIIQNLGRAATQPGNVSLISLDWRLEVRDSVAIYPAIAVGNQADANDGSFFRIRSRSGMIPGASARAGLIFRSDAGIVDTVEILIPFGSASIASPDGPDAYGYICLDRGDTVGWEGPQWAGSWIEISFWDNDVAYEGDSLGMASNALGSAALVNLPFPLRFYGSEYNQITVCSNGFIAVGDQRQQIDFQNSPLDVPAGGACGMIAPFWDHLTFVNSRHGGVYVFYDSTAGTYTVEWYHLRFSEDQGVENTFQAVLYDPRHFRTTSGDSPIRFNYKQISHAAGNIGSDIGFASIGLSSPDGTTGLCVNYDSLGTDATPLVTSQTSLLFVTAPMNSAHASIMVTVTDSTNGQPLGNVVTSFVGYGSDPFQIARTDTNGVCLLTALPSGNYQVVVRKPRYNRLSIPMNISANNNLELRIALTHPEIAISPILIDSLQPNFSMFTALALTNHGNGPLTYVDTVYGAPVVQLGDYYTGVIEAGGSALIPFYLSTFGIQEGEYVHTLRVTDPLAELDTTVYWRIIVDRNTSAGKYDQPPVEWNLSDAYPNPFNSSTRFELSVAKAGQVKLALFDAMGRQIATVWDGRMDTGVHPVTFNAAELPPGIYFARMESVGYSATRKMVLMK